MPHIGCTPFVLRPSRLLIAYNKSCIIQVHFTLKAYSWHYSYISILPYPSIHIHPSISIPPYLYIHIPEHLILLFTPPYPTKKGALGLISCINKSHLYKSLNKLQKQIKQITENHSQKIQGYLFIK